MANSDGQVRIDIITNAKDVLKDMDSVNKVFDKNTDTMKKASSATSAYEQVVQDNIKLLKESALGGNSNTEAFKKLAAQTKNYQDALNKANNEVNKALGQNNQQASSVNKLAGAVKGLVGAYLGVQGIRMVINYSNQAVAAFRTQERAVLQLNQTLQNAGVYSSEYSQNIQKLASEIQSYSNFGDEAIIKAQALGQAYIGNTKITKELTKAVVDFAAATGMDLESAFTLVGKSIGSQTNALGRYGISLQKGMSDSQKMEAITRQLGQRYDGTAVKMADTSVQLKNALGDLSEQFGKALDPAVKRTQNVLIESAKALGTWIQRVRVMKSEIGQLNTVEELTLRAQQNIKRMNDLIGASGDYKAAEAIRRENQGIYEQIKAIKAREKALQTESANRGFKINDDYGAVMPPSSNVVSIQQAKSKQEAVKAETAKIIEQKGAYQLLNEKVSELTAKLRDLAAENQIGSADWNTYKTQLQSAQAELDNVNKSLEDNGIKIENVSKSISSSISSGLINALRNGGNAFDAFSSLATTALQKILDKLIEMSFVTPILNALTGGTGGTLLSLFGFKNGAAFKNGNVIPFAKGGVVNKPTLFPMANGGTGLMGEAGAEAVMPLKRMSNGKLGVEAQGTGGQVVNIYNYSGANVETRKRDDNNLDVFIRRVNDALSNERTSSGFRSAYAREDRKGVQAV